VDGFPDADIEDPFRVLLRLDEEILDQRLVERFPELVLQENPRVAREIAAGFLVGVLQAPDDPERALECRIDVHVDACAQPVAVAAIGICREAIAGEEILHGLGQQRFAFADGRAAAGALLHAAAEEHGLELKTACPCRKFHTPQKA
jgi:hypothetical protein